ncbi:HAMP domain-containing histidine kinase [Spirosoma sp. BT702]|uniref:histidine kinase n=1 Tax=Spirosoma profusum TaxID=2771354 RepID=A0A926Y337_9BACT|nr:HAMP domain-containing sensor histidine kinase [Spirosoma profusum]MBD2701406.1 HAMP domain-containing histidine kinase [Spirosoma profusum]
MKLLAQTNRIYFIFSLVLYLLTAFAIYQIVRLLIYDEVESRLKVEKRDFEAYIRTHNNWSSIPYFVENKIEVTRAEPTTQVKEVFSDTLILNRYDNELIPFRQLTFYESIDGVIHRVAIRKSLIQSYRLIEAVSLTMVLFLGVLLLGMFWFQGKLSERIWRPFYNTLARIKQFDLSHNASLNLEQPTINEFRELNQVLQKMADKMQHDYRNLKEFTENASHEMQTPLALINAKVEQLIQSEKLTNQQTHWIDGIYQASRRMSRLNQGLLLLAKIENRQFADVQPVDLTDELIQRLMDVEEILLHKHIKTTIELEAPFQTLLPPLLAESLLNNLVSNAIRHNQSGGCIQVRSSAHQLQLSNTGLELQTDPETLFKRFKKESGEHESVGLGLAIVKLICDTYQLSVTYQYEAGMHTLTLEKVHQV